MNVRFRPLGHWPHPDTRPRRPRRTFKASWSDTLNLLERELDHLDAGNIVIQADFAEDDIRLDGWPRANARQPSHPGIIVSFESGYGPLQYATDSHEYWQHNLRGIALGLQALRAVDRYGITRSGEQYKGWNALPMSTGGPTTVEQAATIIASYSPAHPEDVIRDDVMRRSAIREALRQSHPDHGGNSSAFDLVQRARRILEAS